MKKLQLLLFALLLTTIATAQDSVEKTDSNEYQIEAIYKVAELEAMTFFEIINHFKDELNLTNETLTAWFSKIATDTELRTVEFTEQNIEMMLLERYMPFPVTQAAIKRHIIAQLTTP